MKARAVGQWSMIGKAAAPLTCDDVACPVSLPPELPFPPEELGPSWLLAPAPSPDPFPPDPPPEPPCPLDPC